MSIFLPVRRATLLIPSGPSKHLFILLTDPTEYPAGGREHNLIVGLSSVRAGLPHDPTCILYPGDHSFIKHESYVNYYYARVEETSKLLSGEKQGLFTQKDTLDSSIFARVCQGLTESRHTAPNVLRFFEYCSP